MPRTFVQLINNEVETGSWKPFRTGRGGPNVSHLFFVDDMLFSEARHSWIYRVIDCLNLFCEVSGQKVSVHKTQIRDFRKYLGVPVLHQRITEQTYNYIIESMQQKLATWKAKAYLLQVGSPCVNQYVLAAVPLYPMQSVLLQKSICNEIEKNCRWFIWADNVDRRRTHAPD